MQALARYWAEEYDWSKCEEKLDALPHFITEIDGLDIHFIHVRSEHEDALPLIVTHGWPGSIVEQLKIIDPLTNPTADGASAADAFHLVIPSLPGYGFSGKPTTTGWDAVRIASAWTELMRRLGYTRFAARGAIPVGLSLTRWRPGPPELIGIHTNMPGAVPADVHAAVLSGGPAPAGLTDEETRVFENMKVFFATDIGYAQELGTHPQTLYGIADSPVGLAAWMIDHDAASMEGISRVFDGDDDGWGLTRDDVLDNITLYWLTNTGISLGRIYRENKLAFFDVKGVSVPVAVSIFPDEIDAAPRSWVEQAYPKLIHYNQLEKGGGYSLPPGRSPSCSSPRSARGCGRFGSEPRCVVAASSRLFGGGTASLPVESRLPGFEGAAGWLKIPSRADGGGPARQVVIVFLLDLHLHQLAANARLRPRLGRQVRRSGIGRPSASTRPSSRSNEMPTTFAGPRATWTSGIPIALDPDYAVLDAFANRYWPAVYIADAEGRIRHHQFGEGGYEECELVIQQLAAPGRTRRCRRRPGRRHPRRLGGASRLGSVSGLQRPISTCPAGMSRRTG